MPFIFPSFITTTITTTTTAKETRREGKRDRLNRGRQELHTHFWSEKGTAKMKKARHILSKMNFSDEEEDEKNEVKKQYRTIH